MKKVLLLAITLCVGTLCFAKDTTTGKEGKKLQSPFYQSYIELSASLTGKAAQSKILPYGLNISEENTSILAGGAAIDIVNGARLNKYLFIGGGVGVHSFFLDHDLLYMEIVASPLYADIRACYPITLPNIAPYIEAAVGPLFLYHGYIEDRGKLGVGTGYSPYNTTVYFKLAVGMDIVDRFTIGLGYELWGGLSDFGNLGFIKLGVRIGQAKNVY